MKRPLRPDELNLWARVAATVRLAPGRAAVKIAAAAEVEPELKAAPKTPPKFKAPPKGPGPKPPAARAQSRKPAPPEDIEPGRMRRLTRERDPLGPRLDLHGLDQDQARAELTRFLHRARDEGWRAVLVITGKGTRGDGVLRRSTPEWLASPGLRDLVAGVSEAHRRHGGQGALYVALKRRPKT
jgi:DNA-nicking Smr family endonuclease